MSARRGNLSAAESARRAIAHHSTDVAAALAGPSAPVNCRHTPRSWARSQKLKAALAKAARGRRRRALHCQTLRASLGQQSVLEELGIQTGTSQVYQLHLKSFWGFVARWGLDTRESSRQDAALVDWADWEFLDGEDASRGEKLLAALENGRWRTVRRARCTHRAFAGCFVTGASAARAAAGCRCRSSSCGPSQGT